MALDFVSVNAVGNVPGRLLMFNFDLRYYTVQLSGVTSQVTKKIFGFLFIDNLPKMLPIEMFPKCYLRKKQVMTAKEIIILLNE